MHTLANKNQRGFTLIELLVVIAIIGLLSSVVFASLNSARGKARDARRLADAREIEKALELYYNDNGAYPSTSGSWRGSSSGCYGGHGNNTAPGLTPTYISSFPLDPAPSGGACYLYLSNGTDYKFLIHGSFETCTAGSCPLQDPARSGQTTGAVYSPGGAAW